MAQDNLCPEKYIGIGLAFDGERLGARWHVSWPQYLRASSGEQRIRLWTLIRWMRMPVLEESTKEKIRQAACDDIAAVLLSTFLSSPLERGLKFADNKQEPERWAATVRHLLWHWQPDIQELHRLLQFGNARGFDLSEQVQALMNVNPVYAALLLKNFTHDEQRAIFKTEFDGIDITNSHGLRQLIDEQVEFCATDILCVNSHFVQVALLERCLSPLNGSLISKHDELNLAMAFTSKAFRRLAFLYIMANL
jgi:hypothetical protein